jgi:hypothetical protein
MIGLRGAAALATCLVATASALSAQPASAEPNNPGCGSGVAVVVDPNELGGSDRVECVDEPGTAAELFAEAGFTLEYQPQLQDFVCKVDGVPTDRRCTDGDSYWSLWWADQDGEWVYSTLGVASLEVAASGAVAFAWHQGDGDAAPPDVFAADAAATATSTADDARDAADYSAADMDDEGSLLTWIGLGLAVLVLGAAGLVTLLRRRSG